MSIQEAMEAIRKAEQELLVPHELRSKGWIYQDFPTKFSPEMWDLLISIIGKDNYKLLIGSSGFYKDGTSWKRGQFLLSPQGQKNLKEFSYGR